MAGHKAPHTIVMCTGYVTHPPNHDVLGGLTPELYASSQMYDINSLAIDRDISTWAIILDRGELLSRQSVMRYRWSWNWIAGGHPRSSSHSVGCRFKWLIPEEDNTPAQSIMQVYAYSFSSFYHS